MTGASDRGDTPIQVLQNFNRGKTQCSETQTGGQAIAFPISLRLRTAIMRFPIDLDQQPSRKTCKVRSVWRNRKLFAEAESIGANL